MLTYLDAVTTLSAGPLAVISVAGSFLGGLAVFGVALGLSCFAEWLAGRR